MSITTPTPGSLGLVARTSEGAEVLGGKSALARLLQVSPSQPTRWIDGSERPSTSNARTIVDLDSLIARAWLVWDGSVIARWSPARFRHPPTGSPRALATFSVPDDLSLVSPAQERVTRRRPASWRRPRRRTGKHP